MEVLRLLELHEDFLLQHLNRRKHRRHITTVHHHRSTTSRCCHITTDRHCQHLLISWVLTDSRPSHHEKGLFITSHVTLLLWFGPAFPSPITPFTALTAFVHLLQPTSTPAASTTTAATSTRAARSLVLSFMSHLSCLPLILSEIQPSLMLHHCWCLFEGFLNFLQPPGEIRPLPPSTHQAEF
jgi:hypothetical protein